MKKKLKLKAFLFILATLILFVFGVVLVIKGKLAFGYILWLGAMVTLINAVNCIWDAKRGG